MNILFLHGLESKLNDQKRTILEKYGTVFAPDMDYKSNPDMIEYLYKTYRNEEIDIIIGSSMGGFAGYHLASLMNIPSMLYNPALPYRSSIIQNVPTPSENTAFIRIVLGGQDDVIKAKDNLAFLAQNISNEIDYSISIRKDLAHQIPVEIFEQETKNFFEMLLEK